MRHPYATKMYAEALSHVGRVVDVPAWGTSVLARQIQGTPAEDIVGPYPIAALEQDADIPAGLDQLRKQGFVSVTLVLDDWHRPANVGEKFDLYRPFKTHYFVHAGHQQSFAGKYNPSKGHWRHIDRAVKAVEVRPIDLEGHLAAWCAMYDGLIAKHGMTGVHAFPRSYFERLAQMPGFETIGGFVDGELVAANIWAVHEGRAHSHLVASSPKGYETEAMYAVTHEAFRLFGHCDVINLGGGAGSGDAETGLSRFKKGFANSTANGYIAGAILDPAAYERLSQHKTDFFPAYRKAA